MGFWADNIKFIKSKIFRQLLKNENFEVTYSTRFSQKNIEGQDLNNFKKSGWYFGRSKDINTTHAPITAKYFLLEVISYSDDWLIQRFNAVSDLDSNGRPMTYIRTFYGGKNWSRWTPIIDGYNIGSQSVNFADSLLLSESTEINPLDPTINGIFYPGLYLICVNDVEYGTEISCVMYISGTTNAYARLGISEDAYVSFYAVTNTITTSDVSYAINKVYLISREKHLG